MKRPPMLVREALVMLLAIAAWAARAGASPQLETVSRVDIQALMQSSGPARAEIGDGAGMELRRPEPDSPFGEKLEVRAPGFSIVLEGGRFVTAALARLGSRSVMVVTEYTGGAHCCGRYHVFLKAGTWSAWRFLASAGAENGGPMPAWESLALKDGRLFLKVLDNRFDYFHACHACSLLGNIALRHLEITTKGLLQDDEPFRTEYLAAATQADASATAAALKREVKARSILAPDEAFGAIFADDLGQLLVKRTILLLYAGDKDAWQSLEKDIARYYETLEGLPVLMAEISAMLSSEAP